MKKDTKKVDNEGLALQGVHERVTATREKPFASKTIAELIEHSHMGTPIE